MGHFISETQQFCSVSEIKSENQDGNLDTNSIKLPGLIVWKLAFGYKSIAFFNTLQYAL